MRWLAKAGIGLLLLSACSAPVPDAISGLNADEMRRPIEALGADCEEHAAGIDAAWALECRSGGGQRATADGTGSDQIRQLSAGGDVAMPETLTWLEALASINYEGADPEAAVSWVRSHLRDPNCESTDTHPTECSITIGEAGLTLEWGLAPLDPGQPTLVSLAILSKHSPLFRPSPSRTPTAARSGTMDSPRQGAI